MTKTVPVASKTRVKHNAQKSALNILCTISHLILGKNSTPLTRTCNRSSNPSASTIAPSSTKDPAKAPTNNSHPEAFGKDIDLSQANNAKERAAIRAGKEGATNLLEEWDKMWMKAGEQFPPDEDDTSSRA
jgi:hypothetical protein